MTLAHRVVRFTRKADISWRHSNVRLVPKAVSSTTGNPRAICVDGSPAASRRSISGRLRCWHVLHCRLMPASTGQDPNGMVNNL